MGANPQVSVTSLSDLDAPVALFRRHIEAPAAGTWSLGPRRARRAVS